MFVVSCPCVYTNWGKHFYFTCSFFLGKGFGKGSDVEVCSDSDYKLSLANPYIVNT